MPWYVYECPECKFVREIEHKMADDLEIRCPRDDVVMEKRIQVVGFRTEGSGFYARGRV